MQELKKGYEILVKKIVGSKVYEKRMDQLSNRLAVNLNMMAGAISLLYIGVDIGMGIWPSVFADLILFAGFLLGIVLFRLDRIELAKSSMLISFNVGLLIIATAEPYETGVSVYFLSLMIAAIVVFGHVKIKLSTIFFILLPFSFCLLANLTELQIIPDLRYGDSTIVLFFVINISVFTLSTSIIMINYIQVTFSQNKMIMEQNSQLTQTNKELDYFLYSTSHDLRAPLTTVMGLINLTEITENKEEVKRYFGLMKNRINKMDVFIQDIIDVIRNTRMPVAITPVPIHEVINGIIQELDTPMGFSPVRWDVRIDAREELRTDKQRFITIFKNIISNAVKYADRSKEDSFVEIESEVVASYYRIGIRDNGIGIDPELSSRIFDMFYRATESSSGAGLGLYIAAETVSTLGGKIEVESTQRVGTLFNVFLPLDADA